MCTARGRPASVYEWILAEYVRLPQFQKHKLVETLAEIYFCLHFSNKIVLSLHWFAHRRHQQREPVDTLRRSNDDDFDSWTGKGKRNSFRH